MEIKKEKICAALAELFDQAEGNTITAEKALPGCEGLVMYESPLIGFADAEDPLFESYRSPEVIGPPYMPPAEWLPGAKTVVSFFFPFTEAVRGANREEEGEYAANAWLHGRIEGQAFINAYIKKAGDWFGSQGVSVCIPSADPRFSTVMTPFHNEETGRDDLKISSAWSERHAAYAAGLGTFSLTRALISEKGLAGRYASIIISERVEPDKRRYSGVYDNCIRCGACIEKCPVGAISLEHGKDQNICHAWVSGTRKIFAPRYGCGKCNVGVPCEARNPARNG